MLERLGFEKLVNETLMVRRIPRVMTIYQFVLGMVLAIYVGFARPSTPVPSLLPLAHWLLRRSLPSHFAVPTFHELFCV
jgi:hypothetical protein